MAHSAAITKRANRRKLDQYFTPASATESLITTIPIHGGILECCAGDSGIADVLEAMSDVKVWVSWVVSNPPFNQAAQISWFEVRQSQQHSDADNRVFNCKGNDSIMF